MKIRLFIIYFLIAILLIMPFSSFAATSPTVSYDKRWEFIVDLVKLMGWKLENPTTGSFTDNNVKTTIYYRYIETALKHNVVTKEAQKFRPNDYITREEAAVILIRAVGYEGLSKQLGFMAAPYIDIKNNISYINMVKDFGLMEATAPGKFTPTGRLKKTEASLILKKLKDKLNTNIDYLNAFYAINASKQKSLICDLSSVGFCWSQLQYDPESKQVILNVTNSNNNTFSLPNGFSGPVELAKENNVSTLLNVFADCSSLFLDENTNNELNLLDYITDNPESRLSIIDNIIAKLNSTESPEENAAFDGVVINFENLRGIKSQKEFNLFLKELKAQLDLNGKKLYVTVQPARKPSEVYYDGYDFKTIGEISDKVILMAHDYNAKTLTEADMTIPNPDTPLTPFDEIYYALKVITDKRTGVADLNKILLQISFGSAQWLSKDGKVINQKAKEPTYQQLMDRITNTDQMENVLQHYSKNLENPWLTYYNSKEDTYNKIWYEDTQSIMAKITLAKMFGIHGISLWRLGNIPDFSDDLAKSSFLDVWQQLLKIIKLNKN